MASEPLASRIRGAFWARTTSVGDDGGGRWRFVARWVVAVAVSMLLAGVLEYVLASRQLVEVTLGSPRRAIRRRSPPWRHVSLRLWVPTGDRKRCEMS